MHGDPFIKCLSNEEVLDRLKAGSYNNDTIEAMGQATVRLFSVLALPEEEHDRLEFITCFSSPADILVAFLRASLSNESNGPALDDNAIKYLRGIYRDTANLDNPPDLIHEQPKESPHQSPSDPGSKWGRWLDKPPRFIIPSLFRQRLSLPDDKESLLQVFKDLFSAEATFCHNERITTNRFCELATINEQDFIQRLDGNIYYLWSLYANLGYGDKAKESVSTIFKGFGRNNVRLCLMYVSEAEYKAEQAWFEHLYDMLGVPSNAVFVIDVGAQQNQDMKEIEFFFLSTELDEYSLYM